MTITAKFPGTCKDCNTPIARGEKIEWSKASGARHADCAKMRTPRRRPMTGAAPNTKVHTVQFNGEDDTIFTRNARGRCEDAPCCGCCTI